MVVLSLPEKYPDSQVAQITAPAAAARPEEQTAQLSADIEAVMELDFPASHFWHSA